MSAPTVATLLRAARAQLQSVSDTPDLDAQLLLAHVMEKPRSWLFAHDDARLTPEQRHTFHQLLKHRMQGEPVAYLLGTQAFYDLTLQVTPDVLIPRPETELLVDKALQLGDRWQQKSFLSSSAPPVPRIVDLGTGSGAIALALKAHRPEWQVSASDLSEAALDVARANARRLQLEIDFRQGPWLTPFAGEHFTLIVSNPPYIAPDDPHLDGSIRFEPSTALIAPEEGLADLNHLIDQAPAHLQPEGWLLLEHGYNQHQAVQQRLRQRGFGAVETFHDLAGHPRVSIGQWTTP